MSNNSNNGCGCLWIIFIIIIAIISITAIKDREETIDNLTLNQTTMQLTDSTHVPSRMWYYLLEFNDTDNWETMFNETGKSKLKDLTKSEFGSLFNLATAKDLQSLKD